MLIMCPVFVMIWFPAAWTGNEEHYFQLALKRVLPGNFAPFDSVFDAGCTKIVSDYLIGHTIALWGYDAAHLFWRVVLGAASLFATSMLTRSLRIGAGAALAGLAVFLLCGQHILGGEGLFGSVEGKGFAYPLIMIGWSRLLERKSYQAFVLMAFASWLHVTAAIYWAGAGVIYLLAARQSRQALICVGLYATVIMPLIYLLWQDQHSVAALHRGLMTADFIYAIIRNPNHVAPFSAETMLRAWMPRIAFLGAFFIGLQVATNHIVRKNRYDEWPLYAALLAVTSGLLLALPISALDATTGFWGKFTLFRPSSLLLVTGCWLAADGLWRLSLRQQTIQRLYILLTGLLMVLAMVQILQTDYIWQQRLQQKGVPLQAWASWLNQARNHDDIVLMPPETDWQPEMMAMTRWLDRPTLVNGKFSPTTPTELFDWFDRMNFRADLYQHGCHEPLVYPVRQIMVPDVADHPVMNCGPVVRRADGYAVIDVAADPEGWSRRHP